jgi:hypothetical protein
MPDLAQRRKHAGVEQSEVIQVIAIHTLNPHPVASVFARISQAHGHRWFCSLNKKSPVRVHLAGLFARLAQGQAITAINPFTSVLRPERPEQQARRRRQQEQQRARQQEQRLRQQVRQQEQQLQRPVLLPSSRKRPEPAQWRRR